MPSPQDIREICQAGKDKDPGWYRIHRRLSIHVTALLLGTPITLNQVSLLMMAMGALGAVLMTSANLWINALAGLCLYCSFLLDKVDGEMARYRGKQSVFGILLDRFHHRLVEPLLFLALGYRAFVATGSTLPMFAALATMLAANIVEEHQQLPPFIAAKHARETRKWPVPATAGPSPGLERVAAVMRVLKTFRMFIMVLPLVLGAIGAEALTGRPVTTWLLLTSAAALWVYVVFQAWYYTHGQLDADLATLVRQLPPLPEQGEEEPVAEKPTNPPSLTVVGSGPRGSRPPRNAGHLAAILVGLAALAAGPASAATYYVDNSSASCSNSGAGTEAQPYCTISAALAARGVAGNTILVKPGTYREIVTVPASGTSTDPLVIRAHGGPVVIDGADDFSGPAKWTSGAGDAYLASGVNWSPKQVIVDGVRLTLTNKQVSFMPVGSYRYVSGQGLYVNIGGGNPGVYSVLVGRRGYSFVLAGRSWVVIDGFTATRADERAFSLTSGASDVQLLNNTITHSAKYGIYVSACARVRIASNVVSDNSHHGIILTVGTTECIVEDNEAARNAVPNTRAANGIYMYGATRCVLRRNRWHDNQDTGQHMQTGSNDNVSYNNLSWNNGDHGFDHLGATGTIHSNDVAYGNYKDGFSIEGVSTGTQLYNCIAVDNGLTTNEFDLWVEGTSIPGFQSDDNIFWNATGQPPVKYGTTLYSSVAAYAAASGQDSRSLQADPLFVDPAFGNFHVIAGSPAIDNGNSSASNWPATDAEGNPRVDDPTVADAGLGQIPFSDRGAFEHQPAGLAPVAVLVADPQVGLAPVEILLDGSGSTDPDGSIVTYEFDFGDGVGSGPQLSPFATRTYAAGSYSVVLTVTDDLGVSSSDTLIVVANRPPVAALGVTPASGRSPLTVSASGAASSDPDGSVASFRFDFGDGTVVGPQPASSASHTYGTGTWQVRLTVTDNFGATDTLSVPVSVTVGTPNVPPTAALTLTPGTGSNSLTVTADASASSDGDGTLVSYLFDFGDSTVVGPQAGAAASHEFDAGTHVVTVTVTDNDGGTATVSDTVVVTEPTPGIPPVVASVATVTLPEGGLVSIEVTASDADGDTLVALTADLSQLPAGNDASFAIAPDRASGLFTWHPTYADSGSFPVTFTASNTESGSWTTHIHVTNVDRGPIVSLPATSFVVREDSTFEVSVTAADPDGDAISSLSALVSPAPAGSAPVFTPASGNAGGTLVWRPGFTDAGSYVIRFTAQNALEHSADAAVQVNATDRAPVLGAPAEVSVPAQSTVSFSFTIADPDSDAIATLAADFTQLPAANDAQFTPGPDNRTAQFTWTPQAGETGSFTVVFTAGNALVASASTVIDVGVIDLPPAIVAPATAEAVEGAAFALSVSVADPDGDAIGSLVADLTGLPNGHGAEFTPGPGNLTGTLAWTPGFQDSGTYAVRWLAGNLLADTAITLVHVGNTDRAPVVSAPASGGGLPGDAIVLNVTAADPDGDAIAMLSADLSALPAGHTAVFTAAGSAASGELRWTPGAGDTGSFGITFHAVNGLPAQATTIVTVTPPNLPPTSVLSVTPLTGNAPLTVTANGTGSLDPEGAILSYRFAFGDGVVVGPQASPIATHVYAAGKWTLQLIVTDELGAVHTSTAVVTVAPVGPGANLVGNPSFESNATGWGGYSGAPIARVAGGFDGGMAMQVTGLATTANFGLNDSPNWVANAGAVGTRYRFGAWVRSPSALGSAKLQVREYLGTTKIGATVFSSLVQLAPEWRFVTVDYVAQAAGSSLDFQVLDQPVVPGEVFLVDNVSICIVPAGSALVADAPAPDATRAGGPAETPGQAAPGVEFGASIAPTVSRMLATLSFVTTRPGPVRVDLFDASGRLVRALLNESALAPGLHSLQVDGRSDQGDRLGAGVYFYRVQAAERSATGRYVIVR